MSNQILIVEDEASLSAYLKTELTFENYKVLVAADGEAALALFKDHQQTLGVVLLDWMIPKLNGLEVLRRIRKQTTTLPVIFMTARDYIGDKVAGLDNGADDYITKPFEIEELLARLRVIFRRAAQQNTIAPRYQVANLTLDTKSHQVTRGDGVIQLTQREYTLLLYLMQHQSETVTRDELLDHVWGVDFVGQTNIVDVYIRYLRNKIDRDQRPRLIHTIRGVGYTLKVITDDA
ncbi:response regulator transcription factor [Furfurilactobacillus curtus]|uniref:DNA-binding response regulator n=1 Tax=Furfurilactobacillus curtus TaxID=1746200 RepID=A0ABQ5JRV0_9LACO